MASVLIRKDAWKLSAISMWEPTLLWYAKAVGEMSSLSATDPNSWRFQAGVHGYNSSTDPFVKFGSIPPQSIQDKFWQKCQHGCWFFLPWHRMYLGFFERIIRATVAKLGGPPDWTLPYWNYSDSSNSHSKTIPPCFRVPTLPDGSSNPLFVIQGISILRAPGINSGNPSVIPDEDVQVSGCLSETFFSPDTDRTSGDLGFGGPAMGFNHDGSVFGDNSLENIPHNAIHVDVGGQWVQGGAGFSGWMINPDTAALDPIFWLHHANIDRLWSVWNRTFPTNTDPTGSVNVGGQNISWPTSIPFSFYDETGNVVTMKPAQVLDPTQTIFSYDYDDTAPRLPGAMMEALAAIRRVPMQSEHPEMVGAGAQPVTLTGSAETTSFVIQTSARAASRVAAVPSAAEKTYLKIENVRSDKSQATYEVYVNLPEGADAAAYKEHYAGMMPLFGVVQASTQSDRQAGSGLEFNFDITQLVGRLKAKNSWDDQNIRVTFVPRRTGGTASAVAAGHDPIRVGRVSLYKV